MCVFGALAAGASDSDSVTVSQPRPNLFKRIVNYFTGEGGDSAPVEPGRVKFVFLGGPHYSTDAKFGVALSGMSSFRLKGCDLTDQPSTANLWSDISTAGFWSVGITSTILFPHDARRLNAETRFSYTPYRFWGIGYDKGNNDANETRLHQYEVEVRGDFVWRVAPRFYVGPAAAWNFINSGEIDKPELLEGQDRTLRNYGVGFAMHYDSRDQMNNTTNGCYVSLKQLFRPRFLGNSYAFSTTELAASVYHPLWRGGVLAAELRGTFNIGNPSWAMLAMLGNSSNMRGYYKGRFRDKHSMSSQVELRQRVYKRSGLVAWVGVGNVFHDANSFGQLLPNWGVGYRFELRKNMNLRLDYGWGKRGHSGFVMAVYEAF